MKGKAGIPIKPEVYSSYLFKAFEGIPFIDAMIEFVKNSFDWFATEIYLQTQAKDCVTIVDNGIGMNQERLTKFCSLGTDVKNVILTGQSRRHGTGAKHFLPKTKKVRVRSVNADEPGVVTQLEFEPERLKAILDERGTLPTLMFPLNRETWPHAYLSGTEISLWFANPDLLSIKRGSTLARLLSDRFPSARHSMIHVDKQVLPEKNWGTLVEKAFPDEILGYIFYELGVKSGRSSQSQLRVSNHGVVGEIPFYEVAQALGDLKDDLHPFWQRSDLCGFLSIANDLFLADQGRSKVVMDLSSHPLTPRLLLVLDEIAESVSSRFGIKPAQSDSTGESDFRDIVDLFNKTFAFGQIPPDGDTTPFPLTDLVICPEPEDESSKKDPPPLQISTRKEYELGEEIEVKVRLDGTSVPSGTLSSISWETRQALATVIRKEEDSLVLRANACGHGRIAASVRTNFGVYLSANASYDVVEERFPRLSADKKILHVGDTCTLTVLNADKLSGKSVSWSLAGVGGINPLGNKVVYQATTPGNASILAVDTGDGKTRLPCVITVLNKEELVKIDEYWFKVEWHKSMDQPPVILTPAHPDGSNPRDHTHRLTVNYEAEGYFEHRSHGAATWREWVVFWMLSEFPFFRRMVEDEESLGNITEGGAREEFLKQCHIEACRLQAKMIGSKKTVL